MSPYSYLTILLLASLFISTKIGAADAIDSVELRKASATISQFLSVHNEARQAVGVPPLTWSTKLARYAKDYINERRADCLLEHSAGFDYGENLFWGQGRRWSAADAALAWVAERQWYHYDSNSCSGDDCTHYTQVMWRTTEQLGCAKIVCQSGDTLVVCEYYPPGNFEGDRPY